MAKGRPVEQTVESQPRQFIREIKYKDGVIQKWHYNLDTNPNGPFEVEMIYPQGFFEDEIDEIENDKLPKTKRKYLNPANGKMVAYTRAKELGIV